MSRKTKIIGISLPPEINEKVENYLKESHKTRSEFHRELINTYFEKKNILEKPTEKDLACLLKEYWDIKCSRGLNVIPIVLAIVTDEKKQSFNRF